VLNKEVVEVQVPEKVGVSELMAKDAEDESLRRYKEQVAIPRIGSHEQKPVRKTGAKVGQPVSNLVRPHAIFRSCSARLQRGWLETPTTRGVWSLPRCLSLALQRTESRGMARANAR